MGNKELHLHSEYTPEPEFQMLHPAERKDNGVLDYTTVAETIKSWAEDPYGSKKIDFISDVYGIDPEKRQDVLEKAGMVEYLKYREQGRFIGMVSTQVLRPHHYFMENAKMLGELQKKGIPPALMVLEYPQDRFTTENADKKGAFGKIEFPVGKNDQGELQTVKLEVRPAGIRHDDGTISRISTINEANGYRCDQILIQIIDAQGSEGQHFSQVIDEKKEAIVVKNDEGKQVGSKVHTTKTTKVHYPAALGMTIDHLVAERTTYDGKDSYQAPFDTHALSMTDFYKTLWQQTVQHLREIGELPSEDEMPMFFVDMNRFYSTLADHANPPPYIREMLKFDSYEHILTDVLHLDSTEVKNLLAGDETSIKAYLGQHDMFIKNGLLVHQSGMMASASYYPVQVALPDLYMECSSCGGKKFVNALKRAQDVRHSFGLAETEVRLPDVEVPELEAYTIHPTGNVFFARVEKHPGEAELVEEIELLQHQELGKKEKRALLGILNAKLKALQHEQGEAFLQKIATPKESDFTQVTYVEPLRATLVHDMLLEGVDDAIGNPTVKKALQTIRQ